MNVNRPLVAMFGAVVVAGAALLGMPHGAPAAPATKTSTVAVSGEPVLLAVTRKVVVGIDSGENGGRKVTYPNVLRAESKVADWIGGKASLTLGANQLKVAGADRYALVLRQPNGGKVLASRWVA